MFASSIKTSLWQVQLAVKGVKYGCKRGVKGVYMGGCKSGNLIILFYRTNMAEGQLY